MTDERQNVIIATTEFAPFRGGLASYSESLATGLKKAGKEVRVLAPRYPALEGVSEVETLVNRFDLRSRISLVRRRWIMARTLWNATREKAVVVATTYLFSQVAILLLLVQPNRFRFVPAFCGPELLAKPIWSPREWWRRLMIGLVGKLSHRIICISEFSHGLAIDAGISRDKLRVVYVGVDTHYFRRTVTAVRWRKKTVGDNDPLVLTTGRLDRRKGHDVAIQAIAILRERYPDIRYLIAGTGEEDERLRAIVKSFGLQAHVVFGGRLSREDLRSAYSAADIFLFPTRQEGNWVEAQGLVVIEAGLCGLPVVAGRHGGVLEIVSHERTGLLIDPYDAAAAAAAVTRLLEDDQLRNRIVSSASEEWSQRFSIDAMVQGTLRAVAN